MAPVLLRVWRLVGGLSRREVSRRCNWYPFRRYLGNRWRHPFTALTVGLPVAPVVPVAPVAPVAPVVTSRLEGVAATCSAARLAAPGQQNGVPGSTGALTGQVDGCPVR